MENHFEAIITKLTEVLESLCDTYHKKVETEDYSCLSYVVKEICDVSKAITGMVEAAAKPTHEDSADLVDRIIKSMGGL